MMNSTKLVRAATMILVTASAISVSACVAPGAASSANNSAEAFDYCVKRGTHMECQRLHLADYASELEMESERLEMREDLD